MKTLFTRARETRLSTSTIADVLDTRGVDGVLDPSLRCVNAPSHYMIGVAFVVEWAYVKKQADITRAQPSTWEQVRDFVRVNLDSARDHVYVAGCGPLMTMGALAGGISCTYFAALGFEGVLLGGAVRDAAQLQRLAMPVVASNFIPTDTQGFFKVVPGSTRCDINHQVVHQGDVVVSDATGTVRIPADIAMEVLGEALELDRREEELLALAATGGDLLAGITRMKRI